AAPPVNVPTCHSTSGCSVAVDLHGLHGRLERAALPSAYRWRTQASLVMRPTEVLRPTDARIRPVVDLLPRVLPHVTDVQIVRQAIERVPPRMPEADRPDLRLREAGVVERNRVIRTGIRRTGDHVDPQELPLQLVRVLGV